MGGGGRIFDTGLEIVRDAHMEAVDEWEESSWALGPGRRVYRDQTTGKNIIKKLRKKKDGKMTRAKVKRGQVTRSNNSKDKETMVVERGW